MFRIDLHQQSHCRYYVGTWESLSFRSPFPGIIMEQWTDRSNMAADRSVRSPSHGESGLSATSDVSVVVPSRDSLTEIEQCLNSVIEARNYSCLGRIIVVDNGSVDGSDTLIISKFGEVVDLRHLPGATIGEVRNHGANLTDSRFIAFLDADCVIPADHFEKAVALLEKSPELAAVGCKVGLPQDPHWIEATWHSLHYPEQPRYVDYINSGNFVVRRTAFEEVGGFSKALITGEDAELGQKLRYSGWKLFESPSLQVAHLGNPKTIKDFWAKEVWHGLGMFGTCSYKEVDKPTLMMFVHAILLLCGLALLGWAMLSKDWRAIFAGTSVLFLVPFLAVVYRASHVRRKISFVKGTFLYQVYFLARLKALLNILGSGLSSRRRN
jgi:GT2 family glycosyltransferase